MDKNPDKRTPDLLPACALEYIGRVVAAIRYRRHVRREVEAEVTAHFEDALKEATTDAEKDRRAQELIEAFGDPKLLAVLCRRAKKRCRPLWQKALVRGAQGLGLFFLYLVVCSLPLFFGKPTIKVNYVQWLSEHWRPGGQGVENAKTYYDQAAGLYVKPSPELEGRMKRWDWRLSDCNDADLQLLTPWLVQNKSALDALRRGAATASYWPVYDANYSDLGDPNFMEDVMNKALPDYRRVVFALRYRIALQAGAGQVGEALDDCLVLQRFARALEGKGLLIEQLVGIALEAFGNDAMLDVLQKPDVPVAALERLQDAMESDFDEDRCIINLDGEKVLWYDRIQRSFTDDGQGGGHALRQGFPYAAGDWHDNLLGVLLFDYPDRREAVAMVEAHFERARDALRATPNKRQALAGQEEQAGNLLLSIVLPAYDRVSELAWRAKTHEAAAITTVAILRYKSAKGQYPARLDALVEAGLLRALPQDPFASGPLSYRKTPEGFVLYSWGDNRRDDSGRQGTDSDGQPRLWQDNGDWVFWPYPE